MVNTMQQVGGALGLAIFTSISTSAVGRCVSSYAGQRRDWLQTLAALSSYHTVFWVAAGVFVAGAVLTAAFFRPRPCPSVCDLGPGRGSSVAVVEERRACAARRGDGSNTLRPSSAVRRARPDIVVDSARAYRRDACGTDAPAWVTLVISARCLGASVPRCRDRAGLGSGCGTLAERPVRGGPCSHTPAV